MPTKKTSKRSTGETKPSPKAFQISAEEKRKANAKGKSGNTGKGRR